MLEVNPRRRSSFRLFRFFDWPLSLQAQALLGLLEDRIHNYLVCHIPSLQPTASGVNLRKRLDCIGQAKFKCAATVILFNLGLETLVLDGLAAFICHGW